MLDNLNAHGDGAKRPRVQPQGAGQADRMADREVPLGLSRTPASVHAWLDGAVPLADVRESDTARHVEFWSRINVETERRRAVTTPTHVQAAIMEALPKTAPGVAPTGATWWRRPLEMSPVAALAAAAGLLALGAVLGSSRGR